MFHFYTLYAHRGWIIDLAELSAFHCRVFKMLIRAFDFYISMESLGSLTEQTGR